MGITAAGGEIEVLCFFRGKIFNQKDIANIPKLQELGTQFSNLKFSKSYGFACLDKQQQRVMDRGWR